MTRVEVCDAPVVPTGRDSGLDVGLVTFATATDPAHDVANPRFARAGAKAYARSQSNMAHKAKGSNNRAKAKRQSARVAARVANQRADFHHKAARALVATYDRIGVEALKVKNMSARGKGPGRMVFGLWTALGSHGAPGIELAHNVRSPGEVGVILAEVEAEAEQAGGTIVRPAARADWGGTSGAFADPEGYIWEVAHNPGRTLGDGTVTM